MTDEALIQALRADLDFMKNRGFASTAKNIAELIKRFGNLVEVNRLLAEREEKLTEEVVRLRP